ncbi:MAG: DUF2007 domain-containing protein [Nitrospiraceae bacterium]|nr:DUF2007 domain-containing protein [Nitrospiraceae bacterium]
MIKLYSPSDPAESALIQSILEEEKIPFFIHNDTFGSMEIGPQIDIYNMKTIMVEGKDEERARELLQDFLKKTKEDTVELPKYPLFDKIRLFVELLLFNWVIPGRHRKKTNNEDNETT